MTHTETIQIKKNKIVEFLEEVEITVGECPHCHKRQEAVNKYCKIDVLCKDCENSKLNIQKAEMNEKLRGAVIEEIIWDEQCQIDDIDKIKIKAKDGSIHSIELCCDSDYDILNIVECSTKE